MVHRVDAKIARTPLFIAPAKVTKDMLGDPVILPQPIVGALRDRGVVAHRHRRNLKKLFPCQGCSKGHLIDPRGLWGFYHLLNPEYAKVKTEIAQFPLSKGEPNCKAGFILG